MTATVGGSTPTLLKALVHERRLTIPETLAALERRAKQMQEASYALSERQLRRWLAGDVESLDRARPTNIRVAEAEFGWSIEALLAPDCRPADRHVARPTPRGERVLRTAELATWVAEHSGLDEEAAYAHVVGMADRIESVPSGSRAMRDPARARVGRAQMADALGTYYGNHDQLHRATVDRSTVTLSILTQPSWVGLSIPLGGAAERCRLIEHEMGPSIQLSDTQAHAALERLGRVEVAGTVMVNNPIYRLVGLDIGTDHLVADFGLADFAAYALTADLLETELRTLLVEGHVDLRRAPTPLRDAWLANTDTALSFEGRLCAGGPVCLVAIADGDQYHLLVQERSGQVLNAAGALAVIPKAFHQPSVDLSGETRLSTTVERELEEELFGRPDLEQLSPVSHRSVAPLHLAKASAPMVWLHEHRHAWSMECTGAGINLVTGTYEIACLVVVSDPSWWARFAHLFEANWETMRLQRFSSLDTDGLGHLIADPRWSNEGLFAFLLGIRRLAELDAARVALPAVGFA